jgi:plastocyanin
MSEQDKVNRRGLRGAKRLAVTDSPFADTCAPQVAAARGAGPAASAAGTASAAASGKLKALDSQDTFFFTFPKPGEYEYFCPIHPHMTGQVIVTRE